MDWFLWVYHCLASKTATSTRPLCPVMGAEARATPMFFSSGLSSCHSPSAGKWVALFRERWSLHDIPFREASQRAQTWAGDLGVLAWHLLAFPLLNIFSKSPHDWNQSVCVPKLKIFHSLVAPTSVNWFTGEKITRRQLMPWEKKIFILH